jgi:hypothetical protein
MISLSTPTPNKRSGIRLINRIKIESIIWWIAFIIFTSDKWYTDVELTPPETKRYMSSIIKIRCRSYSEIQFAPSGAEFHPIIFVYGVVVIFFFSHN